MKIKRLPIAAKLSLDVGLIHIIGIGGIGMSGIAEVLHNQGFKVQGSDMASNPNTERLQQLGIKVFNQQTANNLKNVAVVVKSSAIKPDNAEIIAAKDSFIPIVKRSEMLAELMRLKLSIAVAGTHGKTTTTTMISSLMAAAKLDPTIINGGIINSIGSNAYLGQSEWMVVEADESDGTFCKLPAAVAVVTNIDPEHLDFYGNYENLKKAFETFVENIPFYGYAVMCHDHPEVQKLISKVTDRRVVTYGTNAQSDVQAVNIRTSSKGSLFDVQISPRHGRKTRLIKDIQLSLPGKHNLLNCLAAISIATELEIAEQTIKQCFEDFEGVKRRFTRVNEINGISIIDDYAHHPTEILATIEAAKSAIVEGGKITVIAQPHRYSRVEDLLQEFCSCFNEADNVLITDIFAAGEKPIKDISATSLVRGIAKHGHKSVIHVNNAQEITDFIAQNCSNKDYVIFMGAGDITKLANQFPSLLKAKLDKTIAC